MQDTKLIIEINKDINKKYVETLKAILESLLEIQNEDRVEIYDAKTYVFESEFAKTIFEEYSQNIADSLK